MSAILDPGTGLLDAQVASGPGLAAGTRGGPQPRRPFARLRLVVAAVLGLQLVVLLVVSTVQYHRFALGQDFAGYTQAWWKIAHGHLDPWSTIFTTPFWRNDGELLMWPLALLYHLFPSPVGLLWLQDAAAVATEMVALWWVLDVLSFSEEPVAEHHRAWLGAGALAAFVANPWFYEAVAYDFHFEMLVGLFAVLAGRDLWAGRTGRMWWWVALALASHDVAGGLCVLGLGLSGVLAGRRTRPTGWMLAASGFGWIAATSAIGAAGLGGRLEHQGYGYLAGSSSGAASVLLGIPYHLPAVVHLLSARWPLVLSLLASAAVVGVLSPWALGVTAVVLTPSVLNANPAFLFLSFQNWPVLPFVVVGSVMVLLRVLGTSRRGARQLRAAVVSWCACAVGLTAALGLPAIARIWIPVPAAAAAALGRAEALVPAGAEVVATVGVVGRFAERDQVYPFPFQYHPASTGPLAYPVERRKVAFVFVYQGRADAPPGYTTASIRYVTRTLQARALVSGPGVRVLLWTPPPGTTRVTLPPPS